MEKIVSEREANGPFESIYDFVRRVDPMVLNRRSMESLIKAGAFDSLGVPRLGFLLKVDEICRRDALASPQTTRSASRRCSRPSARATDDDWEGTEIALSDIEFDKSVKLDFEREMLGTYISDHPLYEVESQLATKTDGSIISVRERGEELARTGKAVIGRRHPRRGPDPHDQVPASSTRAWCSKTSAGRWRSTSRRTTSRSSVASSPRTTSCW